MQYLQLTQPKWFRVAVTWPPAQWLEQLMIWDVHVMQLGRKRLRSPVRSSGIMFSPDCRPPEGWTCRTPAIFYASSIHIADRTWCPTRLLKSFKKYQRHKLVACKFQQSLLIEDDVIGKIIFFQHLREGWENRTGEVEPRRRHYIWWNGIWKGLLRCFLGTISTPHETSHWFLLFSKYKKRNEDKSTFNCHPMSFVIQIAYFLILRAHCDLEMPSPRPEILCRYLQTTPWDHRLACQGSCIVPLGKKNNFHHVIILIP